MNVARIGERGTARPDAATGDGASSPGERARLLIREARIAAEDLLWPGKGLEALTARGRLGVARR